MSEPLSPEWLADIEERWPSPPIGADERDVAVLLAECRRLSSELRLATAVCEALVNDRPRGSAIRTPLNAWRAHRTDKETPDVH